MWQTNPSKPVAVEGEKFEVHPGTQAAEKREGLSLLRGIGEGFPEEMTVDQVHRINVSAGSEKVGRNFVSWRRAEQGCRDLKQDRGLKEE